jgi:hypothetical protein
MECEHSCAPTVLQICWISERRATMIRVEVMKFSNIYRFGPQHLWQPASLKRPICVRVGSGRSCSANVRQGSGTIVATNCFANLPHAGSFESSTKCSPKGQKREDGREHKQIGNKPCNLPAYPLSDCMARTSSRSHYMDQLYDPSVPSTRACRSENR